MFKKIISTLLAVVVAGVFLAVLIGCEKDEIQTQRQVEIKDTVVEQDTVVE